MPEQARSEAVLAYWLLPASPAREFFRKTIQRLAGEFDAPVFEPHLTLAIGPDSAVDAERILADLTATPFDLITTGVHFTAKFTQTLFVRFESNPELEHLRDSLGLGSSTAQPFDPHLSLLYKKLPAATQRQLSVATEIPFSKVRFEALRVVRCRLPVATPADVARWEVVASRSFAPIPQRDSSVPS